MDCHLSCGSERTTQLSSCMQHVWHLTRQMSLGCNNTVDRATAGDGRRMGVPRSMFAVLFRKQHGWLSTSIQQLWPAQWPPTCQTLADVKVGTFPPRQAAACRGNSPIITILFPFPMTYLLSLTPLSSSRVLMRMHKG